MDNDKKNFCTMYPPLTHRNYIDTDIVSNKERFYMGGFTKPLKKRKNMKMTIKEFFESLEYIVIHCDTEEKAKALCNAFDREGYKWSSGKEYTEYTNWNWYKEETCYDNTNGYSPRQYYQGGKYKIIEFEDIDMEKDEIDDTKLDTFKAFHWLGVLLDGGNLDEYRLKYLRTFTQVICDILSDHEIYTTNDLRDAMKELECIQALDEVRNDLHDLEYNLNDIQLKIERSRSKWKK